jgi:hypothetical protein
VAWVRKQQKSDLISYQMKLVSVRVLNSKQHIDVIFTGFHCISNGGGLAYPDDNFL